MYWKIIPDGGKMKVKLDNGAYLPERAHEEDAGLDLRTPREFVLKGGFCEVIDTGVHIELPRGTYGRLESKSGLHVKHDIVCVGGTIDEGYTGSIRVKLYNLGVDDYTFKQGDKIVQLVILPVIRPELEIVDRLESTDRGDNGFGSSGR